jgi:NADH-ubiquinone oxidoreductase chain 1
MTEHAAVVFVFFFLAEYGSIVLMCILTSIFFFGGYLFIDYSFILNIIEFILRELFLGASSQELYFFNYFRYFYLTEYFVINSSVEGLLYGLNLGLKSSIMIFTFI